LKNTVRKKRKRYDRFLIKIVKNEETGQSITENIICRPTNETTIEIYEDNNVDINALPECENFSPLSNYEGLWTSLFVKPLAWIIIKIGTLVKNYKPLAFLVRVYHICYQIIIAISKISTYPSF